MTGDPDRRLGLHTDLYELRMAASCLRHDLTAPATFSLYIRPNRARPWYLAAGIGAALEVIERFTYGPAEIDYLSGVGLPGELLEWLAGLEPTGEMWAVPEGTVVLAQEPLLEFTAPLPQAMLLETALINVVQLPTLIATKAARCTLAADGRLLADFGFRRAHGLEAGIEAARAASLGGVGATSNVEAGRRFGIRVTGTMAHSFVQAVGDEERAFRMFAADHPDNSILLVDTYDSPAGIRNAIIIADEMAGRGEQLSGVRLDSGDLGVLAGQARRMLDEAGHTDVKIFASGGVDEHVIARLVADDAPIDAFGIGTALTVSKDHPAFDIVYKLVSYDGQPRAKYSEGKVLLPGPKQVFRRDGPHTDVLACRDEQQEAEALLEPMWQDGKRMGDVDLETARQRAATELEQLPAGWRRPDGPADTPLPAVSDQLSRRTEQRRHEDLAAAR